MAAGLSLGEYTALTFAGALTCASALLAPVCSAELRQGCVNNSSIQLRAPKVQQDLMMCEHIWSHALQI